MNIEGTEYDDNMNIYDFIDPRFVEFIVVNEIQTHILLNAASKEYDEELETSGLKVLQYFSTKDSYDSFIKYLEENR